MAIHRDLAVAKKLTENQKTIQNRLTSEFTPRPELGRPRSRFAEYFRPESVIDAYQQQPVLTRNRPNENSYSPVARGGNILIHDNAYGVSSAKSQLDLSRNTNSRFVQSVMDPNP